MASQRRIVYCQWKWANYSNDGGWNDIISIKPFRYLQRIGDIEFICDTKVKDYCKQFSSPISSSFNLFSERLNLIFVGNFGRSRRICCAFCYEITHKCGTHEAWILWGSCEEFASAIGKVEKFCFLLILSCLGAIVLSLKLFLKFYLVVLLWNYDYCLQFKGIFIERSPGARCLLVHQGQTNTWSAKSKFRNR